MALQGSITFKGLSVPKAYLDLDKITIDVQNDSAVITYRVYANHDAFKANPADYLTTHTEAISGSAVKTAIASIVSMGREAAKKEGKKYNGFRDYVPGKK